VVRAVVCVDFNRLTKMCVTDSLTGAVAFENITKVYSGEMIN